MQCPVCSVELQMAERQGIEIDYCPRCRGVWLDRGELDKIIERSAPTALREDRGDNRHYDEGKYRPSGDRDEDDRSYGKKRKRGSFLDDIFDF